MIDLCQYSLSNTQSLPQRNTVDQNLLQDHIITTGKTFYQKQEDTCLKTVFQIVLI